MPSCNHFDHAYGRAIRDILDAAPTLNERTGKKVRAIPGVSFKIQETHLPLLTLRDIRPLWSCVEAVWFISGSLEVAYIQKFGFKAWDKFADEHGRVLSATGFRWRHAFGVDQFAEVIGKLEMDRTSRQGVMLSWDPRTDLMTPGPNVPCVMIWHVHVIDGRLHMSVLQRSADMYFGLPHDILGSRIVQEFMAAALDVKVGTLLYSVSNAHLYEDQWENAEEMIYRLDQCGTNIAPCGPNLGLTRLEYLRACALDEVLPLEIHSKLLRHYEPWPPMKGPKLAL